MVATRTHKPKHRRKSWSNDVHQSSRVRSAKVTRGSANEAEVAAQGAWNAVKEAVNSGKTQPVTAARATGKAVRNVARSGQSRRA